MTALRTNSIPRPVPASAQAGNVVLTHAYADGSAGDRLLVDLSVQLIRDALGPRPDIIIHAAQPVHTPANDLGNIVPTPGFSGSLLDKLAGCSRIAAGLSGERFEFRGGFPELEKVEPNLIVGVGGGYLRTGSRMETLRTTLAHLPQVLWAASQPVPSIYLPLSVGPLGTRPGRRIRDGLERIDHLLVRDDRTASLFMHHDGMRRVPDLGLIQFVNQLPADRRDAGHEKLYLAADRAPSNPRLLPLYIERIKALRELLPDAEILLENDDSSRPVYGELGWDQPMRTVDEALRDGPTGVMIANGLDTALKAMLEGWPTVQLATERKGFGAFNDLNLSECIRKATCFDPAEVATIATSLRFGRIGFWERVREARSTFDDAHEEMVTLIAKSYIKGIKRRRALV